MPAQHRSQPPVLVAEPLVHPQQPVVVNAVEGSGHRLPITVIFQIR